MSNIKKKPNADISSKKLKIKNKKEVAKVLTKNKSTMVTAKKTSNVRKKPVVKKVVKPVEIKEELEIDNVAPIVQESKPAKATVKKDSIKTTKKTQAGKQTKIVYKKSKPQTQKTTPKKVPVKELKEEKIDNEEKAKEEPEVKSVIKPKDEHVTIEKTDDKKEIKSIKVDGVKNIKKRAEAQKPKDLKPKKTTGTKKDKVKKVKSVYDPVKNKWVLKDDKEQIKKDKEEKKRLKREKYQKPEEREEYLTDTKFSGIKSKFLEEVYVESYKEETKKNAKKLSKKLLIFLIICGIFAIAGLIGFNYYKELIKAKLNMYPVYVIGDEVKLKDDSVWYVVEDSDGSKPNIILLSRSRIDITGDGKVDLNDKKMYSQTNAKFDVKDETGVAYYLNNEYKTKLEAAIGEIVEVSMLSTKQYVDMRDRFGFGYQWKNGNILASPVESGYWIISDRNGMVYVVKNDGTFILDSITSSRYVRPIITIKKDQATKVEKVEPEEKTDK